MNFSDKPESVRVDFWKPSGKWYATEAVIWTGNYKGQDIFDGFAQSLYAHLHDPETGHLRYSGMRATCLHPCHEHAHPISMEVDDAAR